MKSANEILLKVLGVLLLVAAALKGWQLLTGPVANADIWSNRYFLIFTVEFELALGIWLLSGLFKKAAWLVGLLCFAAFSCITLYKGITGADSCGCFGAVKVNPWITLLSIDVPAIVLLSIFRPKDFNVQSITRPVELLKPLPNFPHFACVSVIVLIMITICIGALALNEPATVTSNYEVLEPETWIGKELPILEHIDIKDQISEGNWLLLLYHHGCPSCQKAIVEYKQMARNLEGNDDILKIGLIEVPPYGQLHLSKDSHCMFGRLEVNKKWFVTTPITILSSDSKIIQCWKGKAPEIQKLLDISS